MRRESHNTSQYIRMMLRNRSGRLFVPVLIAYVILTAVCFYYRREAFRIPDFFTYVTEWCHRIIPMFACWWVLILYDEFVSGEGNELLYLYLSPGAVLKAQFAAVAAYFVWIGIYIGGMQFFFAMKPFFRAAAVHGVLFHKWSCVPARVTGQEYRCSDLIDLYILCVSRSEAPCLYGVSRWIIIFFAVTAVVGANYELGGGNIWYHYLFVPDWLFRVQKGKKI